MNFIITVIIIIVSLAFKGKRVKVVFNDAMFQLSGP